jgi:dipeptidyl aminopeptidase/acylaminoacyl peptidase
MTLLRPAALDLRSLLELRSAAPLDATDDALLVGSDLPGRTQLFRLAWEGGDLEQLTELPEPVDGRFIPGSSRILLQMDDGGNERMQLSLLDGAGAEPEPLVRDPDHVHREPELSRDGSLLAYATNRTNGVEWEIVVRSLAHGDERVVYRSAFCSPAGFSPDAALLVVSVETDRSGDNDLYLVDAATGEAEHVSPHDDAAAFGAPAWLPGGDAFLAATSAGRDTTAIARYDLGDRRWETVLESDWDLECRIDESGRTLLVTANEDGYGRLELRDPRTLELGAEVPLPGRGVVDHAVFSPDGARLAFSFSSPREPGDVWSYDIGSDTLARLTELPRAIRADELAEPDLERFRSFDGESVPVFLWEPEGEGPFPVVVMVHGGPEAQFRPGFLPSFTPLTQHLVSRGYAVAAPNVRGSTGYGKRYEHLDDVRLRLDSVRDLAALHDWLDARPRIDARRAVLYGRSYGGYMVLAGLAFQPERWAAGIEMVGISSFVTFLENTAPWRRAVREREYGSLERDRDFLAEASPITHVDRIRAPLFIQHGANDPRVPLGETRQIHQVLTEKGIRCDLVVHEDEGHAIGKLENRIEAFERAVKFLDEVV